MTFTFLHNQLLLHMSQERMLMNLYIMRIYNYYLFMGKSSLLLCLFITWTFILHGLVNLPSCTVKPKLFLPISFCQVPFLWKTCRSMVALRIQIEPYPWRCWTTTITGLSLTLRCRDCISTAPDECWTETWVNKHAHSVRNNILLLLSFGWHKWIYIFIWQSAWSL